MHILRRRDVIVLTCHHYHILSFPKVQNFESNSHHKLGLPLTSAILLHIFPYDKFDKIKIFFQPVNPILYNNI